MYVERPDLVIPEEARRGVLADVLRANVQPGPGGSCIVTCAIRELADLGFRGVLRIVGLWPSSQIVAHADPPIVGRRYHIPLQTNPGCWSFSDGVWQQLTLGVCYQIDPAKVHGAVNWGDTLRLHLMVDVED